MLGNERACIGEVYEFEAGLSGYPAARGHRYLIYKQDELFDLLVGRDITDPTGSDILVTPEGWPKAARFIARDEAESPPRNVPGEAGR